MIASRHEIMLTLDRIEVATRNVHAEKKSMYADFLEGKKITTAQLGDALTGCLENWTSSFFPGPAQILKWARPPAVNAGQGGHETVDAITGMEREIAVQTAWLRRFEQTGSEYGQRMARLEIERLQEKINRRLVHRNQAPKYVGVGVEVFGGGEVRSQANKPMPISSSLGGWADEGDWSEDR